MAKTRVYNVKFKISRAPEQGVIYKPTTVSLLIIANNPQESLKAGKILLENAYSKELSKITLKNTLNKALRNTLGVFTAKDIIQKQ